MRGEVAIGPSIYGVYVIDGSLCSRVYGIMLIDDMNMIIILNSFFYNINKCA